MVHEEKRIAKIVEELTIYFFALGADTIESKIHKDAEDVIISFTANYQPEHINRINQLETYFNKPKNEGIEDVYWELAGSGDPGETSQLLLVGMMIDRATIQCENGYVTMELYKRQAI